MSQKQVDLADRTMVGGDREIERDRMKYRDKPSVLEDSSYTEMTSASAPEGMLSNRSEPNVGFWNRVLVLLWSAASKITPLRPAASKRWNMTAVPCPLNLQLFFITPVVFLSIILSETLHRVTEFLSERFNKNVSATFSIDVHLYRQQMKLFIY